MRRDAGEIDAANRFHTWRLGWRDGAMRRAMNPAAANHSDLVLAAAYREGYCDGTVAARAADAAACERYGHAPTILRVASEAREAAASFTADDAARPARERGR